MILPTPEKDSEDLHIYGRKDCPACQEALDIGNKLKLTVHGYHIDNLLTETPKGWRGSWNIDVTAQLAMQDMAAPVIYYRGQFIQIRDLRRMEREFDAKAAAAAPAPAVEEHELIGSSAGV